MSKAKWEEEREKLLENLGKAELIARESQAEAAVCQNLLEDYYEAARQAVSKNDINLLPNIAHTHFSPIPTGDSKQWGKLFLYAYKRDAGWLEDTKKALEKIKNVAEKLSVEDNEANAELKQRIIAAAELGLRQHI
ncbi:MAG: hypothetical protein H0T63_00895 [Pyrinomonadaceae bacterium]|jgi:hypothetical protein|nr:hypothetical protein [Pyrinomonadaceae bacterium]